MMTMRILCHLLPPICMLQVLLGDSLDNAWINPARILQGGAWPIRLVVHIRIVVLTKDELLQGGASDGISSSSDVYPPINHRDPPCSPAYIPPLSDSDGESDAEMPEADPDIELVEGPYLNRSGSEETQVGLRCRLLLLICFLSGHSPVDAMAQLLNHAVW